MTLFAFLLGGAAAVYVGGAYLNRTELGWDWKADWFISLLQNGSTPVD